ncbi:MAG: lipid IV(A) 3-deoxy-D-manno-octulosonic acid transferase [Parahaliea sp.]
MRFLYSLLLTLLMPLIVLRMLWRSRRSPQYRRRLGERLGLFNPPADDRPMIWVHAVSVGETLAAAPLIEQLIARYPGYRLVVTTTTPTGSERVRALFGERVFHVYVPWDLPGAVRRFLRRIRPRLLLVMETELWPNLLHYSHTSGCRTVLANARLSRRSAKGYARLGGLTRRMLGDLDCVACQSPEDGERLVALGLPRERLHITGSIKFDLELDEGLRARARALREPFGAGVRSILVAASTHPGEDEQLLAAFAALKQAHADALLVLVPRHPERFDSVHSLCSREGWQVARRSRERVPQADTDILLGDTMGELLLLFSVADVAVIGGSLVEHGGHNALEAAAWGVPVVSGPWMFNFEEISSLLVRAGGMLRLPEPGQLELVLLELFADTSRRERMGRAALAVVAGNGGARERLLQRVAEQLPPP